MANQSSADYYRSIAKMRDTNYKQEELSNLGKFYRDTAEDYRNRSAASAGEFNKWNDIWEDRFKRAEDAYLSGWKAQALAGFQGKNPDYLRMRGGQEWERYQKVTSNETKLSDLRADPSLRRYEPTGSHVSAYNPNSQFFNDKTVSYNRMFDRKTGERLSMEQIIKLDTSRRGNKFLLGQEGDQFLFNQQIHSSNTSAAESYQKQFDTEQAMLVVKNEEAKKKFIADKQQALSDAQSLSYRGATYIEKPL
jgi:hypothetical protein